MTTPAETLQSRFPTRIHRLDLGEGLASIDLLAPVDPDSLLDDPVVEQRYKADNYLPYWPIIWPSGLMLAEKILRSDSSPPALPASAASGPNAPRVIELGCGLGTTGIAAGKRGWHVTFTDYDPEAIEFAGHNALRNGIPADRIRAMHMDWRSPLDEKFSWVLASDVLYERRLHPILLGAVKALLAHQPEAQAWVSDPHRTSAEDFPVAAVAAGFKCRSVNLLGKNFAGGEQLGTLYILTWGVG